jgi:hypothetical protein
MAVLTIQSIHPYGLLYQMELVSNETLTSRRNFMLSARSAIVFKAICRGFSSQVAIALSSQTRSRFTRVVSLQRMARLLVKHH